MPASQSDTGAPANPWAVRPADFPVAAGTRDKLRSLVNYAVLAPSGHNSQPWQFRLGDSRVEVLADRSRRLPVVDPHDRELTMSCAAAAETMAQAARAFGFVTTLDPLPEPDDPNVVARIEIASSQGRPVTPEVIEAIVRRRTTRRGFTPEVVPDTLQQACVSAARAVGISVFFAGDAPTHRIVADLVAAGDRRQFDDPAFRRELAHWIRPQHAPGGDGISGTAFGMPDALSGVGAFMIRTFDIGGAAASGDARLIRKGSPLFMMLASPGDDPVDWVAAGRALAAILIRLSAEGWTASYLNQPIEVSDLRPKLKEAFDIDGQPQLLMRVGRAELPAPSARRPVDAVLVR
ncbi:Acg family FMN-binding oxidoreductase [Yoonia sp.]|uniref:Acg family FMN-binding oxidoreductase n=1 Tax=Yoonia sp. TaxID=2212373 RepID=UPI003F6DA1A5